MATDLLKPGGYLRLSECMRELEQSDGWKMTRVDVARLNALAEKAVSMAYTQKHWKPDDRIDVGEKLPLTDCYVAPCVTACAIKQDIPEYIRLMGEQRYADALELIYVAPWTVMLPGAAIMISVLLVNLLGDGIRRAIIAGVE